MINPMVTTLNYLTKQNRSKIWCHIVFIVGLLAVISCKESNSNTDINYNWVELFNGEDLEGWTANESKRGGDENSLKAEEIFTVSDGVIYIYKGAENGSKQFDANLYHRDVFSNFHLQLEYRWLHKKFQPRAKVLRDAGVLFHIHNNPGEVWPSSIEMQLGDGQPGEKYVTGDLWCIHTLADVPTKDGSYFPGGLLVNTGKPKGKGYDSRRTSIYAEKPRGEWNTIDIHVDGSKSAKYYLNDVLVNEVYNMKYQDEEGNWIPLEKGHISLQGEWSELQYKNIRIKENTIN